MIRLRIGEAGSAAVAARDPNGLAGLPEIKGSKAMFFFHVR